MYLPIHELVVHCAEHLGDRGHVEPVPGPGPHPLEAAGPHVLHAEAALAAHRGPLPPDELVLVAPVLRDKRITGRLKWFNGAKSEISSVVCGV